MTKTILGLKKNSFFGHNILWLKKRSY